MKALLFGCKDTTLHVADWLKSSGVKPSLVTISEEKGLEQEVAGYVNLMEHRDLFDEILVANRYDLKDSSDWNFFESGQFDIGIAIGWQRLIPKEVLSAFSIGVFGMHGSAQNLPFGKGRSPMNWSIIEGREWFYTNLFKYNVGVDDGPIVDTECFSINKTDTAETLHYKNTLSMINMLRINWGKFESNNYTLRPQIDSTGSYYPKRSPKDGIVDWDDSVFSIDRLIRAVAKPFYGAFSFIGSSEVVLHRASIFYTDLERHSFSSFQTGSVCDVFPSGKFLVRCNGGVLIVHEHASDDGLIEKGAIFHSPKSDIAIFNRNRYGFFDN